LICAWIYNHSRPPIVSVMVNWGKDLWDRWPGIVTEVTNSTKNLESTYNKFFSQRAKIEKEYATSLRRLIKNFTPKKNDKEQETTQTIEFRLLLEEIGFLAGQHEMIDTTYGKDAFEEVKKRAREVKKEIDGNKKQFKEMEGQMNKSYQRLEGAKNRYRDAHNAMETASTTYDRKSVSMDVTKNDIERAKNQMEVKIEACQNAKKEYAAQVKASNQEQKDHYTINRPHLITRMMCIYKENSTFIVNKLKTCISKEKDRSPIISKCHEAMLSALERVNTEQDCQLVAERHKTGEQPPDEIQCLELQPGESGNRLDELTRR